MPKLKLIKLTPPAPMRVDDRMVQPGEYVAFPPNDADALRKEGWLDAVEAKEKEKKKE